MHCARVPAALLTVVLVAAACGSTPSPTPDAASPAPTGSPSPALTPVAPISPPTAPPSPSPSPAATPPLAGWTATVIGPPRPVTERPLHLGGLVVDGDTIWATGDGGAIWRSSDAITWTTVELPGDEPVRDLAHGPNGYVALGCDKRPFNCVVPIAWSSADGTTWRRTVIDTGGVPVSLDAVDWFAGRFIVSAMACLSGAEGGSGGSVPGGPGVTLAMARSGGPDVATAPAPCPPHYAMWSSTDGVAWRSMGAPLCEDRCRSAGLVVLGDIAYQVGRWSTLWRSTNGRTWTQAKRMVPHGDLVALEPSGRGLVAVAQVWADGRLMVFRSSDGVRWVSDPAQPELVGAMSGRVAIAATPTGLVMVGSRGGPDDVTHAAVWTAVPGKAWTVTTADRDFLDSIVDVAVFDGKVVLLAASQLGAQVWTRPLPYP